MLEHQLPLASPVEARSTPVGGEPGFRVTLSGEGLLLLQSRSPSTLEDALASEIRLRLPGPGEACVRGDYALLWLTPAEWLLECPVDETDSLRTKLIRQLTTPLTAVTDMSDAFACFEVGGARAADILMSGCSLDLRADAFPSGRVARTALADIPVILRKTRESQCFRCFVDRGYARHIRDWLAITTK